MAPNSITISIPAPNARTRWAAIGLAVGVLRDREAYLLGAVHHPPSLWKGGRTTPLIYTRLAAPSASPRGLKGSL